MARYRPLHARKLRRALELLHRASRACIGSIARPISRCGCLLVRGGGGVVEGLAKRQTEARRRPVDHRRGERERMDVDPRLSMALTRSFRDHHEALVEGIGDVLRLEEVLAVPALEGGALLRAVLLEERGSIPADTSGRGCRWFSSGYDPTRGGMR